MFTLLMRAQRWEAKGNEAMERQDYQRARECYTMAAHLRVIHSKRRVGV
jgi:hypothetical protein